MPKLQQTFIQLDYYCSNLYPKRQQFITFMDISQSFQTPPSNYPSSKHKTHGLSVKPSVPQILSYILIVAQIIVYFICIFPNYLSYSMLGLYSIFGIVMILSSFLSTTHNPTDRIVYYYKWSQKDSKIKFKCNFKQLKFCNFCDSYCNMSSKHCKDCNRCVPQFDHHCIWFNNCVGKSNYKSFFISIVFTFLHLLMFIIHGIVMSVKQNSFIQMKLPDLIVVWIFMLILSIFQFLLINLIALHIYLYYIGLTTYEFLKQSKAEDQKKQKQIIKKQEQILVQLNEIIQKQESIANIATIIRVSSQDTSASTQIYETKQRFSHFNMNNHAQRNHQDISSPLSKQFMIVEKNQEENQNERNQEESQKNQVDISKSLSRKKSETVKERFMNMNYQIQIDHVANLSPEVKSQNQQDLEPSEKTVKIKNRCRTIIARAEDQDHLENQNSNKKKFSSYFKNNRSFKFILNGDSPRAQSPRKHRDPSQRFSTTKKKDKTNQIQLFSLEEPTREQPNNN